MQNYLLELMYVLLQQIICTIKIRRAPTRHDNVDIRRIITRTSTSILPLSVVTADKGYDSEERESCSGQRTITGV